MSIQGKRGILGKNMKELERDIEMRIEWAKDVRELLGKAVYLPFPMPDQAGTTEMIHALISQRDEANKGNKELSGENMKMAKEIQGLRLIEVMARKMFL